MANGTDVIAAPDWRAAWLDPYRESGAAVASASGATGLDVAGALNRLARGELRFVGTGQLPAGQHYETFIARTRTVPTRDNLHDLFNGLVWLTFPLAKRRLNALHAQEIGRAGGNAARGPLRDALTVFDENGALLQAPPALIEALAARDWQRLFIDLRALWRDARLVLFGHALLEKLVSPRKAICAHVLPLAGPPCAPHEIDAALAALLDADALAAKPFLPLPVLGVPGWWPDNENSAFYDDAAVFRPKVWDTAAVGCLNARMAPAPVAARAA